MLNALIMLSPGRPTAEQLIATLVEQGFFYSNEQVMRALQRLRIKGTVVALRTRPINVWSLTASSGIVKPVLRSII